MKSILYVMTHRSGDIETFSINNVEGADIDLLNKYSPETLEGTARKQFDDLLESGYSLSNWHVVEA